MNSMASEQLTTAREAADRVRTRTPIRPEVGIVLGTGLGDFARALDTDTVLPYAELPGFPVSTVESHAGELHVGRLAGRGVAIMKGRVHYYEGYAMRQVGLPVRVLRELGCRTLILTSAVGAMNPDMPPGSIVVTSDHINLMGASPLIGPNDDAVGPRFPDMSEPYSRRLIELAERVATVQGWTLQRAVLVAVAGPALETPAEYRFLRGIGADVVGMSVVPETLVAVHGGQRVLAFNVVTDACLPDNLHPVEISEILRIAAGAAPRLMAAITEVVRRLDEANAPPASEPNQRR
jgi:purine-nucleoside phosphorylase